MCYFLNASKQLTFLSFKGQTIDDLEDIVDPYCDPEKPVIVTFDDVKAAYELIKSGVRRTPCIQSHMVKKLGIDVYLKMEMLQQTGSFKERGARNTMLNLSPEARQKGIVSASLGNHSQGVSYHGNELGIPVTVVMPKIAPIMKIEKCRKFNANVVVEGLNMDHAKKIALHIARDEGSLFVNGYDHPHIIAGQGTIALEIFEQEPDIDAIVVPVGGGGLISGIAVAAKALNPNIKIIAVESEHCASYAKAKEMGEPTYNPVQSTLADGLAVSKVGYNAWATSKDLVDKCVVVKEATIAVAILRFIEEEKAVVEGAGGGCLAAILEGQLDEFKGKKIVLILSGGNIDTTILGRCLTRGLAVDGRLVKFKLVVRDRPGGICELCTVLNNVGVSVKDVFHERTWVDGDAFSVEVTVVCETREYEHALELRGALLEKYPLVRFDSFPEKLQTCPAACPGKKAA